MPSRILVEMLAIVPLSELWRVQLHICSCSRHGFSAALLNAGEFTYWESCGKSIWSTW